MVYFSFDVEFRGLSESKGLIEVTIVFDFILILLSASNGAERQLSLFDFDGGTGGDGG